MPHNIAKTVSQLVTRIEDFSNMKAAAGGQLSEDEYYHWVVPISKLWETVYDTAYSRQAANVDDWIVGQESEHERGLSVLTAVLKEFPFPAVAGDVATVCLPPYDQSLLRKVFVGMLPQLKVAAGLLTETSEPKLSKYRTPTQWRALRKAAGLSHSERTWGDLRKKHAADIQGEPGNEAKSCRITRSLAESWGLSLPEFDA